MSSVEVVNLTTICRNFPLEPQPEIHREYLLNTIDNIFNSDTQIVVVEGLESIGKSILMSQFANTLSQQFNIAIHKTKLLFRRGSLHIMRHNRSLLLRPRTAGH